MKDASYAPMYCAMYPELAEIARKHGYALAVHGSIARDFDLICIPWISIPNLPQRVVDDICSKFAIRQIGNPEYKIHNRLVFIVSVGFGECFLDLSFMPAAYNGNP